MTCQCSVVSWLQSANCKSAPPKPNDSVYRFTPHKHADRTRTQCVPHLSCRTIYSTAAPYRAHCIFRPSPKALGSNPLSGTRSGPAARRALDDSSATVPTCRWRLRRLLLLLRGAFVRTPQDDYFLAMENLQINRKEDQLECCSFKKMIINFYN